MKEIERKAASGIILTLLASMLTLAFNIQQVKAEETIYIRPDGTVDPSTAPIKRVGDVYTFTSDIYEPIVVEADNIVIDGNGYTLQGLGWGYGFYLSGRSGVTIKDVTIEWWSYGILLDYSSSNSISGNNVTANNEAGITLSDSSNYNIVSGNSIAGNSYGISLGGSSGNIISENNMTDNGGAIALGSSSDNIISGNNMINRWSGISLSGDSKYNNISGNNISGNNNYGVNLYLSSDNSIVGNNITAIFSESNWCVAGVHFYGASNNSISGNNITNYYSGIETHWSSNNSIYRNNVENNSHYGIWVGSYSTHHNVSENNVTANAWTGILIASSSNNSISGNNVADSDCGVSLDGSSNNVSENNIKNNNNGIWLLTPDNSISGNNIKSNNCGILLGSSGNTFYHNNFIDNGIQVYIYPSGYANVWDDGYPSGGNYWSDFVQRYPDAKELHASGIWDTPYILDENNKDNYPLMEPWSPKPPGPNEALNELLETIKTWNLSKGTENSLISKLDDALHLLAIGNENGAIHKLMDFMSQIEALRDKKLNSDQADYLVSEAQRIIDLING